MWIIWVGLVTVDSNWKQLLYPQFSRFYLNYPNPKQQVWTKYHQDIYVYCADLIASPLRTIFNQSIISGVFPGEWKLSKVIPLFKHGERTDLNNYRPISIVPVVAKVFGCLPFTWENRLVHGLGNW